MVKNISIMIIIYIFIGIFIGFVFHLFQDSLTKSGVDWLYPFKHFKVKGEHSTYDKNQKNIDVFISALLILNVMIIIFVLSYVKILNITLPPFWLFEFIVVCLLVLMWVILSLILHIKLEDLKTSSQ